MLCIALMGVFAQAGVADSIARVQHLFAGGHDHVHLLFADIALDDHHAGDHGAPDSDGSHHAPSHHHNGESGLMPVLVASVATDLPRLVPDMAAPEHGRVATKVRHAIPERPPRAKAVA